MACCAIAAFLFSQLYLGAMAVRRWLGLKAAPDTSASSAAGWRSGSEAMAQANPLAPRRRRRLDRWLDFSARRALLAVLLSVGSVGVVHAVVDASPTSAAGWLSGLLDNLCSS